MVPRLTAASAPISGHIMTWKSSPDLGNVLRAREINEFPQLPEGQRHLRRTGVIYFPRPADERELVPIEGSPLLQRLGRDKPIDEQVFCMADFLDARKHGFKRYEYDLDRPRHTQKYADFFAGEYSDTEGHQSLSKFDNVPREVYVPSLKTS